MSQKKAAKSSKAPKSTVEIQRPTTWLRYKSGMCDDCWSGCCTLPVEVSAFDLIRLGIVSEDEAAASLKRVARRLLKEGIIQDYRGQSQIFILEQRQGRDCIFLDESRRCTVYEDRPEVCRRFPKIGPRPGYCPKIPKA